jgi:hypothetical protein
MQHLGTWAVDHDLSVHSGFADLAAGLIEGCIEHFGETIDVQREDLSGGLGTHVRFSLTQQESP